MSKKLGIAALLWALSALPQFAAASEVITNCPSVVHSSPQTGEATTIVPSIIQTAMRATLSVETLSHSDPSLNQTDTRQLGSGVMISPNGYFLTNAHVVGAQTRFSIRLFDGRIRKATVVGLDRLVDIALVKIDRDSEPAEIFPFLSLKLSNNPQIGEPVVALGYPMNFGLSATRGIVSGHGRAYDVVWPVDFLQHDAALNPGNSGGPLIDAQGCLIGLNTATPVETQFDIGVGLAIPADLIGEIVPQLLTTGTFPRGHLGIYVSYVDQAMTRALGLVSSGGLIVDDMDVGASAALAGLEQGDLITHLDDRPVRQVRDLSRFLLRRRQGEAVEIKFVRNQQVRVIRVALGRAPASSPAKPVIARSSEPHGTAPLPDLGFIVANGASQSVIQSVTSDSLADLGGLQTGDVILALNGTSVQGSAQAQALLNQLTQATDEPVIILRIGRADMRARHITLRLSRSSESGRNGRTATASTQSLPYGPL